MRPYLFCPLPLCTQLRLTGLPVRIPNTSLSPRPAIIHRLIVLELVRRSQMALILLIDVNCDGQSHFPTYLALAEEFIFDVFALARQR